MLLEKMDCVSVFIKYLKHENPSENCAFYFYIENQTEMIFGRKKILKKSFRILVHYIILELKKSVDADFLNNLKNRHSV